GLKPGGSKNGSGPFGAGEISFNNDDCNYLAANLESRLGIPVIDQTGLTNHFDIDLKWKQSGWENVDRGVLNQALLDQLGLELVPTNMPVEMLIIEKAK